MDPCLSQALVIFNHNVFYLRIDTNNLRCGNSTSPDLRATPMTIVRTRTFQLAGLVIDHFTVVARLPGLRMEARLPVTLF